MSKYPADTYSLVADIGGTNTRVALAKGTRLLPETVRKYSNAGFPGLETVLRLYVEQEDNVDCTGACVAVAGPVRDSIGELTNLDWTIDKDTLIRATRAEHVQGRLYVTMVGSEQQRLQANQCHGTYPSTGS